MRFNSIRWCRVTYTKPMIDGWHICGLISCFYQNGHFDMPHDGDGDGDGDGDNSCSLPHVLFHVCQLPVDSQHPLNFNFSSKLQFQFVVAVVAAAAPFSILGNKHLHLHVAVVVVVIVAAATVDGVCIYRH